MDKRNRRQKASDVFQQTNYLFPKTDKFDVAFPTIDEIAVEATESGDGIDEFTRRQIYNKKYLPGKFIDCHNPRCYNGGFDIGSLIRRMESDGETERKVKEKCQGYEGSPKGRIKYRECLNFFDITVKIKYKNGSNK
jgi:hypothetical protein